MNITRLLRRSLLFCLVFSLPFSVFPQGSLTPPGAPASTMKSLDQIEVRIPISSAQFTISSSGSYYLTKNLSVTTGDAIRPEAALVQDGQDRAEENRRQIRSVVRRTG